MKIRMGPVLGFRGDTKGHNTGNKWNISALVVAAGDAENLVYKIGETAQETAEPVLLTEHKGQAVLRYDLPISQTENPRRVQYSFAGSLDEPWWQFVIPGSDQPPKMAYASCNGFSDPRAMKNIADKHALWNHLRTRNDAEPYHLLLLGGDQVYADTIWDRVPSIKEWSEKPRGKRRDASFTQPMQVQVPNFYFELYRDRWSQPEMRDVLASIPTVMMWDDHDIFDGWGSHHPKDQASPVFQGIYQAARNYFNLFQQNVGIDGIRPGRICSGDNLSLGFTMGAFALLVLDMRSERSDEQVLSRTSWGQVLNWLDRLPKEKCRHLLIMTSIPVVHPDFSLIESLLWALPGQQEIEDDLRDHWHSRLHKAERLRLIHRLLKLADDKGIRITLLSGDVHVAAVGVIESQRHGNVGDRTRVINQLTSSAIVHPAPPGIMLFALEHIIRDVEQVDQQITAQMLNFPGTRQKFIGARNWLSLEPDETDRIWANWYVEGDLDHPHTKVIHPVDGGQAQSVGA